MCSSSLQPRKGNCTSLITVEMCSCSSDSHLHVSLDLPTQTFQHYLLTCILVIRYWISLSSSPCLSVVLFFFYCTISFHFLWLIRFDSIIYFVVHFLFSGFVSVHFDIFPGRPKCFSSTTPIPKTKKVGTLRKRQIKNKIQWFSNLRNPFFFSK